jgi:DNA-binding response OmpR family regulator
MILHVCASEPFNLNNARTCMALLNPKRRASKVLIVDDEADVAIATYEYLKSEGFRPAYAANGRKALDWIEENGHPDVIVLDLNMPVMNGHQFMQSYDGPSAIIVATGNDQIELPRKPYDILIKPFMPDALLVCIESALNSKGGPKWMYMLPCDHTAIGVEFHDESHIAMFCLVPGCEKRKVTHTDTLDFETVLQLTMAVYEDINERGQKTQLS